MLATPPVFQSGDLFRNVSAPATNPGTTSTSGAAHTKGAWVQFGADLTSDVYGLWFNINSAVAPSAADSRALIDIGIDLSGGTTFTSIIDNMMGCGIDVALARNSRVYYIPMRFPNGSALAFRHQATLASDVIRIVSVSPTVPTAGWGQTWFSICDTYGADTAASEGTLISTANIGASGAEGTWVTVTSATTRDHRGIILGLGVDGADTSFSARGYLLDVGIDPAGGTAYRPLLENLVFDINASEDIGEASPYTPHGVSIPEGSALAVRASSSGTAADNLSAILHGFS